MKFTSEELIAYINNVQLENLDKVTWKVFEEVNTDGLKSLFIAKDSPKHSTQLDPGDDLFKDMIMKLNELPINHIWVKKYRRAPIDKVIDALKAKYESEGKKVFAVSTEKDRHLDGLCGISADLVIVKDCHELKDEHWRNIIPICIGDAYRRGKIKTIVFSTGNYNLSVGDILKPLVVSYSLKTAPKTTQDYYNTNVKPWCPDEIWYSEYWF